MMTTRVSREVTLIPQLIIRQLTLSRYANFSWNGFVYIFYYTGTDEIRSMHDTLLWWCRIQDLPDLMLLGAG